MRLVLKKTAAAAAGLLLVLCVLEAALRISGWMSTRRAGADLRTKTGNRDAFVILCLGDSFTYGCEAPEGRGYPQQLEEQFARRLPGRRVIVVNRGVPCANTRVMIENLPAQIARIRPDLITVLAGVGNNLNFYGLDQNLRPASAWSRIRIVRLAWLAWSLLQNDPRNPLLVQQANRIRKTPDDSYLNPGVRDYWLAGGNPSLSLPPEISPGQKQKAKQCGEQGLKMVSTGRFREAADLFRAAFLADPGDTEMCLDYCNALRELGSQKEALALMDEVVTRYPGLSPIHSLLEEEQFRAGNYVQSVQTSLRAIRFFPDRRPHYDRLVTALRAITDEGTQRALADQLQRMDDGSPLMREYILYADWICRFDGVNRNEQLRQWVLTDLEELYEICTRAGIPLVMQNYPQPFPELPDLEQFASRHHIPFVDQLAVFSKIPDRTSYFATSHCNEKGCAKMAEALCNRILADKLIPDTAVKSDSERSP